MSAQRDGPDTDWLTPLADPALLGEVLGVVPLGVHLLRLDDDGELVVAGGNPSAFAAFAADERIVGARISDLLPERSNLRRVYEEARANGKPVSARLTVGRDGGPRRVVELTAVPLDRTVVGLSHDVTDVVTDALETSAYNEAILRSTPDQVWVVGRDLTIRHVGGATMTLSDDPTAYVGRNARLLVPPDAADSFARMVERALADDGIQEARHVTSFGGAYEIRAVKLNDDEVVALVRDMTDRRRAEQALEDRAALDLLVAEASRRLLSAPAADTEEAICDGLEAVARHLGADSATLGLREDDGWFRRSYSWFDPVVGPLPGDPPERLPPEAFPWAHAAMAGGTAGVLQHSDALPEEAELERAMLTQIGAQSAAMVPIHAGGALRGYVTFYWRARRAGDDQRVLAPLRVIGDVLTAAHERAQAERARDEADERLRTVFDALDVAVIVTGADRTIVAANRCAEELLGQPLDELLGTSPHGATPPLHDDGSPFAEAELPTYATLVDGQPRTGVLQGWPSDDGSLRWMSITTRPLLRPESDTPAAVVTTIDDVTQLRALEAQLAQAAKMEALGRLAGGIAHDFNNLLTVMSGYTELLLDDLGADSDAAADLDEIAAATARAAALVDQLLSFSRRKVADVRAVDVHEVLAGMDTMLRRVLPADIVVETHLDALDSVVPIDRGQLEQVVLNLAVNAGHAMPGGGRLVIETSVSALASGVAQPAPEAADGPFLVLTVSDTGVGMDAPTRARAFEPFFTTKPVGQGTGLGLSTVYGTVAQAGGHVGLYSEPGDGTTVRMYLPLERDSSRLAPVRETEEAAVGGTETILVVEDDPAVRSFTVEALHRLGYTVLETGDGAQARRAARVHQGGIDLLLTDGVLPDARGSMLAMELRRDRPSMPVVLMSGYSEAVLDPSLTADLLFLGKPFQIAELARAVRLALDGPEDDTDE